MTYDQVLSFYGNVTAICAGLSVSRQTPYNWKARGIPVEAQIEIEVATNGALKAALPPSIRKSA